MRGLICLSRAFPAGRPDDERQRMDTQEQLVSELRKFNEQQKRARFSERIFANIPKMRRNEKGHNDMPQRVLTARDQYLSACEYLGKDKPTDREAYDLLDENYKRDGKPSPLPAFSTWTSYLRIWRKAAGQQKKAPRADREHGGSIVGSDQI